MRRAVLHSLNPEENRFRFFILETREHDGAHQLVRRWGRIGTEGRVAVELTGTAAEVAAAFELALARRLQRGYRIVDEPQDAAPTSPVEPTTADPPKDTARELGALVAWEARLVDALLRTRRRMSSVRERLRPRATVARPPRPTASAAAEQLELFPERIAE